MLIHRDLDLHDVLVRQSPRDDKVDADPSSFARGAVAPKLGCPVEIPKQKSGKHLQNAHELTIEKLSLQSFEKSIILEHIQCRLT